MMSVLPLSRESGSHKLGMRPRLHMCMCCKLIFQPFDIWLANSAPVLHFSSLSNPCSHPATSISAIAQHNKAIVVSVHALL